MVQRVRHDGPAQAGKPPATPPLVTGRRAAARLRLAIPARLVTIHITRSCVLLDLSRSGARIGLAEPLAPDECAYLQVAGLELFGEVVWRGRGANGGLNGLSFDQPLGDAAVLAVRAHAETHAVQERTALLDQVRRWVSGDSPI